MVFCDWHFSSKSLDIDKKRQDHWKMLKNGIPCPQEKQPFSLKLLIMYIQSLMSNNRTNDRVLAQVIILKHLLVSKRKTPQEEGCHCLGISE